MVSWTLLRTFWKFSPQLFGQFRRISKFGVVKIDVSCDYGLDAAANPICSFGLVDPYRLEQLKDMARLDLADLEVAYRGVCIVFE